MLTIKNGVPTALPFRLLLLVAALLLAACAPSGPRAFTKGKELLDKGDYAGALAEFRRATTSLSTNAVVWQYLGVAAHRTGQSVEAERAYTRALALDRDLLEARYSLGCLLLEQNRNEEAKTQFVAYNLRRGGTVDGLSKLGAAQLRSQDITAAERTFTELLRLQPDNAEALNSMGLARLARNKPAEAAQYFASALKHNASYAPAMLNLAVVRHQALKDKQGAIQFYRLYLSTKPQARDAAAVAKAIADLEQELNVARFVQSNAVAQSNAAFQRPLSVASDQPNVIVAPPAPGRSVAAVTSGPPAQVPRSAQSTGKPVATSTAPASNPPPQLETVRLPSEPVLRTASDVTGKAAVAPREQRAEKAPEASVTSSQQNSLAAAHGQPPRKKGFLQKINPLNLIQGDDSPKTKPPQMAAARPQSQKSDVAPEGQGASLESRPSSTPYKYKFPRPPVRGDRASAEVAFAEGVKAQSASKLQEAIQAYRRAIELDPSYFEAHYNLGLAYMSLNNPDAALAAYEHALAARPASLEARYNFALALGQAAYLNDAVREFERILAANPNESRANLALANIYAQQVRDSGKARPYYLKVLELEPRHPQANAIRSWLGANPK